MNNQPPILFALDYDDTYTRDPELWLGFIQLLRSRGHDVVVVTMRCEVEQFDMDQRLLSICETHFTCGQQKKPTMDKKGIYISIWIDDRPDWIVY